VLFLISKISEGGMGHTWGKCVLILTNRKSPVKAIICFFFPIPCFPQNKELFYINNFFIFLQLWITFCFFFFFPSSPVFVFLFLFTSFSFCVAGAKAPANAKMGEIGEIRINNKFKKAQFQVICYLV